MPADPAPDDPKDAERLANAILSRRAYGADDCTTVALKDAEAICIAFIAATRRAEALEAEVGRLREIFEATRRWGRTKDVIPAATDHTDCGLARTSKAGRCKRLGGDYVCGVCINDDH